MLLIHGATYRYAGAAAPSVRDISLELEPGRVIGVVGANGAGKSTLCLVAVGLAPGVIGGVLEGRVEVDGLPTTQTPMHQLAQHAGILFQQADTQLSGATPTVWEEVCFGPRNLSLPLDEAAARTWAALDALGIADLAERDPGRLSGGQAQLVALAGVLALRPRYLVLDEPTSQLDPAGTRLVADGLANLARGGSGVLIAEHKTDLLARLCDEIVVLSEGAIVRRGGAPSVLQDPSLPDWGVPPPPALALRRAVESAELAWDESWA